MDLLSQSTLIILQNYFIEFWLVWACEGHRDSVSRYYFCTGLLFVSIYDFLRAGILDIYGIIIQTK